MARSRLLISSSLQFTLEIDTGTPHPAQRTRTTLHTVLRTRDFLPYQTVNARSGTDRTGTCTIPGGVIRAIWTRDTVTPEDTIQEMETGHPADETLEIMTEGPGRDLLGVGRVRETILFLDRTIDTGILETILRDEMIRGTDKLIIETGVIRDARPRVMGQEMADEMIQETILGTEEMIQETEDMTLGTGIRGIEGTILEDKIRENVEGIPGTIL